MVAKWYIVQAYSNFEKKVAEALIEQARSQGLEELFEEIIVPTEKVQEVRRGRKYEVDRRFFPGYVLVKMDLTDAAFLLVKNTPKVTGFLGAEGGRKPIPVSEKEVQRIVGAAAGAAEERPRRVISFEVGENVRVTEGPFQSFTGSVEEVDDGRGRVKVSVSIFGRATPVDLEFGQVEKVA